MGKWEMVPIPDVVFFQEGPGVRNTQYTTTGIKLLNVANLQDGKIDLSKSDRYISEYEAHGKYKHFLVDEGDLIIASSGIQVDYFEKKMGFINASHLPLCMNTSTIRFKSLNDDKLSIRFFMYCLKTLQFKGQLKRLITGSAQLNFGPSHIKKMEIPLPPLHIQRQIADVLDRASALIEKRKAQIEKLDLLIKSQFIEMFGNPVSNPKGWKKKRVKECLKGIENGVSPKCEAFPALFEQYGVLKLSAVTYGHYIEQENKQLFPDTKFDTKIEVCSEDLLMTRKNTYDLVGMCAYVFSTRSGLMLPDLIFRLIPKNEVHSIYLWQLINCDFFRPEIKKLASGTSGSMPNISKERLNSLEIPVPPVEIQRKFASFVRQVEAQKSLLQQSLTKLEQNYKSLMQKCFRGEIF